MYYSRMSFFVKYDVILNFDLVVWQAGFTSFQRRQSLCYTYSWLYVVLFCVTVTLSLPP